MTMNRWSQTASSNDTADSTINWRENQAPSTVNNSARAMMAAIAKYRDDIAGGIATGGTSSAYTVTSYQVFSSLTNGLMVAFTPAVTNAASPTLAVDGLTAKPIRARTGVALPAGTLIVGTPYVVTYNSSQQEWMLMGTDPGYEIAPIGTVLDYAGATAPNSFWALAYGQAVSRATYAALFAVVNVTYGSGDGVTTFNLPDCRGRVRAGFDDMGGSAANRITAKTNGVAGFLGATGGLEQTTIAQANLPAVNLSSASLSASSSSSSTAIGSNGVTNGNWGTGGGSPTVQSIVSGSGSKETVTPTITTTTTLSGNVPLGGSGTAINNIQPTIVMSSIIRVL